MYVVVECAPVFIVWLAYLEYGLSFRGLLALACQATYYMCSSQCYVYYGTRVVAGTQLAIGWQISRIAVGNVLDIHFCRGLVSGIGVGTICCVVPSHVVPSHIAGRFPPRKAVALACCVACAPSRTEVVPPLIAT